MIQAERSLKLVEPSPMAFNYDIVAAPVAVQAREAAQRIKLRLRRSTEDIIEIGRDLITMKNSLPHGQFLPWITAEFGMGQATAYRFMNVAEVYGTKLTTVISLDPSALYELAAPKTPLEVREEIEKMIAAGDVVTKATVQELRTKISNLENEKTLAEQEFEQKDAKVSEFEESINTAVATEIEKASKRIAQGYEDEISRLKREIAELKKPKPVTTIDNATGNVVAFGRPLSDADAEAIEAEYDDYKDADFHEVASDQDKAVAFFGCIRSIAKMNANPKAVYQYIKAGRSPELVAEYMAMVDQAFSQLKTIKDSHNG